MLEKIYGKVIPNYRINLGTLPEEYMESPAYVDLAKIYDALIEHRGHVEFVKINHLRMDYYLPNQQLIVEFDESQHFTEARSITLGLYPDSLNTGFSVSEWQSLCQKLNTHDNNPPYRDEQRAWYDTLRDFLAYNGYFTVRLYAGEAVWCNLNPNNEVDVRRFKKMIAEKIGDIRPQPKYAIIPKEDWITTITLENVCGKDPGPNEGWLDDLKQILETTLGKTEGDGIILFPAGWLNTGKAKADSIYSQVEDEAKCLLEKYDRHIFIVLGIDGYQTESGNDRDQIGLAIDKFGIQAIARKHYPTHDDESFGLVLANGPNELEYGKPRTFELNGVRYYIAVCYDIMWAHNKKPDLIPDASVILNPIHKFAKYESSSFQDFVRKGMGLESKFWNCPVFGSVKFINRKIPSKWATGIFWKFKDGVNTSTKGTTIAHISIDNQCVLDKLPEGVVDIRIFKNISQKIEAMEIPSIMNCSDTIQNMEDPDAPDASAKKPSKCHEKERFTAIVEEFKNNHPFENLVYENSGKSQSRWTFQEWKAKGKNQNEHIFYEFDYWGKREDKISVEILFAVENENFYEIAKRVFDRKNLIEEKINYGISLEWNQKASPKFIRLQLFFPDYIEEQYVAKAMIVLIQETKDIVNDWVPVN
ncbi:MAG: hypothetical protein PHV51_02520 [Methanosarcinaceae archaeon]|nr:hypothetical protein [Methanosarcinaceae archaeon]